MSVDMSQFWYEWRTTTLLPLRKDASMKPLADYHKNTLAICWATVLFFELIHNDSVGKTCADACPISDRAATLRRRNLQAWLLFTVSTGYRGLTIRRPTAQLERFARLMAMVPPTGSQS